MADTSGPGRLLRLSRFVRSDHRYVFLGTSVMAALGIWFSMQPRSRMSFLAPVYTLEVLMYYLLVAWLIFAALALVSKLMRWNTYAETSPFVRPALKRLARIGSYVVVILCCVFFVDRAVMSFATTVATSIAADSIPTDRLAAAIYMLYEGRSLFITGIETTIELAVFGTIIAFFLALLMAFLRIMKIDRPDNDLVRFLKVVASKFAFLYSTVIRGTPMMVQALIIYNAGFAVMLSTGMTAGHIRMIWTTFIAGLTTVSLNSTAYMMEVLRGGIESVDIGQTEAARSLGLTQWQTMLRVVFPQGVKFAIPGLSNELVINIKDSSVLSVIGVVELMYESRAMAGIYYRNLEVYLVAALFYLIMTMIANWLLNKLSKRLDTKPVVLSSVSDQPVNASVDKE